jgi:hypothetical protein
MAGELRGVLAQALRDRNYSVLLDEERINPGDLWRAKLYRWLAECQGGLLLLTESALESEWVGKEVTILMWRAAVSRSVRVVPILIEVTQEQVQRAFPQLHVDDLQMISVRDDASYDQQKVVGKVIGLFEDLAEVDDAVQLWAERLSEQLDAVGRSSLTEMARWLHVGASDWISAEAVMLDGATMTLAHAMLENDSIEDVEDAALVVMKEVRGPGLFYENLAPLGVETNSAASLISALYRPPGSRIAVLNAQQYETAVRYLDRANCVRVGIVKLRQPMVAVENAADSLCAEVYATLADELQVWKGASLPQELARLDREDPGLRRRVLVLTGRGCGEDGLTFPVLKATIKKLRAELPHLALLVFTGLDDPDRDALGCPDALLVSPQLTDPEQELRDNAAVRRLRIKAGVQ